MRFIHCLTALAATGLLGANPALCDDGGYIEGKGSKDDYQRALIFYSRGNAIFQKGDLQGCIQSFKQAVKIYPYFAKAYYNLGFALLQTKDYAGAEAAFTQAGDLNPKDSAIYMGLGTACEKQHKLPEAEKALRQSASMTPRFQVLISLGDVLRQEGKFSEAKANFLRAKALPDKPDNAAELADKKIEQCEKKDSST